MTASRVLEALPADARARLLELAHETVFPSGTRLFEEGDAADRFWIIRSGAVALDLHVPGVRAPVLETVGAGELLGWSWLVPPHQWRFGAQAKGAVEAHEFDAAAVRDLTEQDPAFAAALLRQVTEALAHRLAGARERVLSLYGTGPRLVRPTSRPGGGEPGAADGSVPRHSGPFTVGDVMTSEVVAVDGTAPFLVIAEALRRWKVSALPVIERSGQVVGMVSEADLMRKQEFRDRRPLLMDELRGPGDLNKARGLTAEQLMSSPVVTIRTGATVAEAARLMARHRVKRLPVTDEAGRLNGIVSRGDLLVVFTRGDEEVTAEVRTRLADLQCFAEVPDVRVADGVVTVRGVLTDTSRIGLVVQVARSVEGVVDVVPELTGRRAPAAPPPAD
ncbi:CBS domain-containing protein [Streptomyces sp. ACA25]|uniref:CBS domain-containing protein n=1 Tax=Streptomyces sp. ACA25 TaxID=3022596 RepID=UPI002FDF640A